MTDPSEQPVSVVTRREALSGAGLALGSLVASGTLTETVLAQSGGPSDEISGTVEDDSGAVGGATVVAVPHDTSLDALETTTASDGTYIFAQSDLHEGSNLYHVIARDGTETAPRRGVPNYPFIAAEGPASIPDGAILQYTFEDEGTTATAVDTWNDNDGTILGATYTTSSQFGSHALSFDDVDDYVEIGEVATPSQMSLLVWVNPSTNDNQESIADLGSNNGSSAGFFLNNSQGTPNFQFGVGDGAGLYDVTGGSFSTGVWQQAVVVYRSNGDWEIWIDNTLANSGNVGDGTLAWSGRTWSLGVRAFDLGANAYGGDMDNLEVVGRAVDSTEIDNHYSTGSIDG